MEGQAEFGSARQRPHGGVSPDQFVWWLRGYFEAVGTADNVDFASIRDMLAHVPLEAPALALAIAQKTPCGCGGHR